VTPDTWKEGSRSHVGGADGGKKVNTNVILEKKK